VLAPGETDTDTFYYTASDGNGGNSNIATVTVTLLGADEPDPSFSGLLSAPDVDLF
jgi:VCBS repeat-containing protein